MGGPTNAIDLLFSPTPLIKLICVGTASNKAYFQNVCLGFWSVGDPRRENVVRSPVFRPNQGTPLVEHEIRNFETLNGIIH